VRASDAPFVADWFAVSLRWVTLIGLTVALAFSDEIISLFNFLLVLLAFVNIAWMLMAGLNVRLDHHRFIGLSLDFVIGLGYFTLTGGYSGTAWWVGLVAILTAAIYFEVRGALLTAVVLGIAQAIVTWVQFPALEVLSHALGLAVFFLGLGGGFGFMAHHVYVGLRSRRMDWIAEKERERQVEAERLKAIYSLTDVLLSPLD